jgi:hypothetical protein
MYGIEMNIGDACDTGSIVQRVNAQQLCILAALLVLLWLLLLYSGILISGTMF